jgi:hypothetical protein
VAEEGDEAGEQDKVTYYTIGSTDRSKHPSLSSVFQTFSAPEKAPRPIPTAAAADDGVETEEESELNPRVLNLDRDTREDVTVSDSSSSSSLLLLRDHFLPSPSSPSHSPPSLHKNALPME